ncbi:hypothetical protein [Coleofasciculus sp. G2-EDA-02]|uniref:hypothetical protein n=1 Tax=Coleofasciculus sp. G2-EDA-02 TaxID=3069529 RepID=UPI0032F96B94
MNRRNSCYTVGWALPTSLNLEDLTLDALMHRACDWVGDYLKYNAPESDKFLCDTVEQ